MPAIYTLEHEVSEAEIDDQGHVGNLEYLRWMLRAAVAHSAAQGWSAARYEAEGAGWVVRAHRIEYLRPAFAGDHLQILTWVHDFRKVRSLRRYQMRRPADDQVLAVAETDWTFIGLAHRVPRRVPAALQEAFPLVPADQAPWAGELGR